jgi:hypothetical protein
VIFCKACGDRYGWLETPVIETAVCQFCHRRRVCSNAEKSIANLLGDAKKLQEKLTAVQLATRDEVADRLIGMLEKAEERISELEGRPVDLLTQELEILSEGFSAAVRTPAVDRALERRRGAFDYWHRRR